MPLLDLPLELLRIILGYIGVLELRSTVSYLLVAKRWYLAALPVYLSQLPLSDIYLASHHDLEILPPAVSSLGRLIQTNAHRLSVRLVGHPCKFPSVAPWHDDIEIDRGHDGMKKWREYDCNWTTVGPVEIQDGYWKWHGETQMLHRWGGRINKKLVELATVLQLCNHLNEFDLEASSEYEQKEGPRWDYLHDSTIRSLISSLPSSLNNLTLDACGSRFITPDRSRDPIHLCPLIAERLHNFQNVRLRLRCICPEIFQAPALKASAQSKLMSLVVRLSLPYFPDVAGESSKSEEKYDAQSCELSATPLYKRMIAAGANFAKQFAGLSVVRVSYREPGKGKISLLVADCVRERYMFEGSELFYYEDDGYQWNAWETNSPNFEDAGSLHELLQ